MPDIKKIDSQNGLDIYLIEDESLDDLLDECLKRIRAQSKSFYKRELKKDLKRCGKSHIDRHAGMGNYYEVRLL